MRRRSVISAPFTRVVTATAAVLALTTGSGVAASDPDVPPEVDPGVPSFAGESDPVPDEPVAFDPTTNMMERIFDADQADGGDSYWVDRVLERPAGGNGGNALYTKGRALYMYTHNPNVLGFAGQGTGANQGGGGFAYREAIASGVTNLYTVSISDATLSEDTAQRAQYPSHWSSVHTAPGLSVEQRKFITHNNVAVTVLTLTNTGDEPTTRTITAATPPVVTQATSPDGTERTGSFNTRYNLTTVSTRFSGDGFTATDSGLTRTVGLDPGESTTFKLQLGAIADELPQSAAEYERYRGYDPETAFRTQIEEYNRWWVDNVPYIDVPDPNIKKMSYYRTFMNRFNYFDANIPGNDFQFPVSVEGALGYNNAIQLTQPMHIQDLKYFRNPLYSYGDWVSSGQQSRCSAFTDNPGSFSWGETMEQYIGREAWNAYKIHGGDRAIVRLFAHDVECDVKGQLAKFDQGNNNQLVEFDSGLFTGNDADTDTFHWAQFRGLPIDQDRTESAYEWASAKAAADAYRLLGDQRKAKELDDLAGQIRHAILTLLWDDSPITDPPTLEPQPATRSAGQTGFGNAVRLGNPEPNQYVDLPDSVVSSLDDATFAAWVNWDGDQSWSRIFDFGTGTGVNMFLTPNAGGTPGMRFAITTSGGGAEQQITATDALSTGWHHVAVTLQGTTGTLWVDGQSVATNDGITLSPSDLGDTDNNWIGRSQYGDPLLQGSVDEFQIYDRALSQAEIQSLMGSPGGSTGGGNVAWYRFDEADGPAAVDASGNGRDATVVTVPRFVGPWPGKVFKHRLVTNGEFVQWKDQQNFAPFVEGLVPNTAEYRQALRYYGDADEYPIMPFYTANQRDKAFAQAVGVGGTNNFSNINSTLQAQLYARSLRQYPSPYITEGMYLRLLQWLTWVQYVGGDNRLPNNNEFFFNWDPEDQTIGRSGIPHDILGSFNFMIIDDIAGVRSRLDDQLELWPIDVGWDHFAVNNLSYHGHDLTVVWDDPTDDADAYPDVPAGYSAYVDGQRAFTVDRLAHVVWNSRTGGVTVSDNSGARVLFNAAQPIPRAADISLAGNDQVADMFQKAGVDLTSPRPNLAEGKPATASFTTTTPALRATAPEYAVDGFTTSGLPAQSGTYLAPNTIWGACDTARPTCGDGSPDDQQWLAVDLGKPMRIDTLKLYFFNDKSYNARDLGTGDRYREPSAYTIQYLDGQDWIDVPEQVKTPGVPQANYNEVTFAKVTAQRVRVLMTRTGDFGIGVKEIQIFGS